MIEIVKKRKKEKRRREGGIFFFFFVVVVIFVIRHQGFLNFQNTKQCLLFLLDRVMLSPLQTSATMVSVELFQKKDQWLF